MGTSPTLRSAESRRALLAPTSGKQAAITPPIVNTGNKAVGAVYSDCSADRLYFATLRAVTELGYSVTHSDRASATLGFRTGLSWKSWQGQEMTATVVAEAPTSAKVLIGGKRVVRGRQFQVADWGEAQSIACKLIAELTPLVAATPEPTIGAMTSVAEELERLAQLHHQGALTDDEFATAKNRLLTR
jgi:hypothetical protein